MAVRVALHHKTTYRYDRLVALGPQIVRLRPAPHCRTRVTAYSVAIEPEGHFENWQQDPYGNYLLRLVFPEKTRSLEIAVDLVAELSVQNPFDFFVEESAEHYPFEYEPHLKEDLEPYLRAPAVGERVLALVGEARTRGRRTIDFLVELNRRLCSEVRYVIRHEPGVQSPDETVELRSGSCRDTAWLLVAILRHLGIAARFASGYLIQLVPDEKPIEGPAGPASDFTDLHAWAEAYLPGAGWIGLDPTSGLLAGEGHLPLACTPDPVSAAPVTGSVDECEVDFGHEMSVARLAEAPRPTKPYTDAVWQAIDRAGASVDRLLDSMDVRLTMGGEPTLVSIDDPDGFEWNFGALGDAKRERAGDLLRRLARRFATGGFLHFGQGKSYPGEPLPRWALSCFWRKDGTPVWKEPALVAREGASYGVTSDDAGRFLRALAVRLGVNPGYTVAGYEDVFFYLWRERRLPVNVNPRMSRLDDELERARIARIFEQGLGHVVGFALPLAPEEPGTGRFRSSLFFPRSEHLFLVPGDSPMGYRLPLEQFPWVDENDRTFHIVRDPFAPRAPLGPRAAPFRQFTSLRAERETPPARGESAPWAVRTAICTEVRDGRLHVFMPPFAWLEDYLAVVESVEATAADLELPVIVEGYAPPHDDRLSRFSITPDPGVIEVNIHPSASWGDLVETTHVVYDEARQTKLTPEKFALDGRQIGTGGGAHVTLGGTSPADSPLLRRPDLLASLVGYFHDHPSLSYLFSGQFIGPTSQAPRVDEARHEATYELEIALRNLETSNGSQPPWVSDRTFRHLLADMSGNTHRAEFCIDKLYSPDGPTGRLGLLELRAFEMQPHPRMDLAVKLLIRTLVARFWRAPYRAHLPRWGTMLHDRFLLPHFVAQDFGDVVRECADAGFSLDANWYEPHFEFRFPLLGSVTHDGVEVELRRALEPWHVLAEEPGAAGTVRAVDSSLDRVQVRVRGAIPDRHGILCNGIPVPLHPTGVGGEAVAGVRYRAWPLPRALHPTIAVHTPLVFDVLDRWSGRSMGGCTVHAAHPGGRAYDRLPVNASEAEARRANLFSPLGHSPGLGGWQDVVSSSSRDYPLTLDLRRGLEPTASRPAERLSAMTDTETESGERTRTGERALRRGLA
jgi:uncharacterized protein (DUF2126 family)